MKDLQVTFDIYYDRTSYKRIAKNVCLTDESVDDIDDESDLNESLYDGGIGFTIPQQVKNSSSCMGILKL